MEVVQSAMVVVEDAPPLERGSTDLSSKVEQPTGDVSEATEEDIPEGKLDTESE